MEPKKEPPTTEDYIKWIEQKVGPLPPKVKEKIRRGQAPTAEDCIPPPSTYGNWG
jgi:hypothetical protein